jgi:DNA repair protein RadC
MTGARVEARGIFVPALLSNAAAVILFHTHPSGELTPSRDDLDLTRKFFAAGQTLNIPVLDHLILGEPQDFLSLKLKHPILFG